MSCHLQLFHYILTHWGCGQLPILQCRRKYSEHMLCLLRNLLNWLIALVVNCCWPNGGFCLAPTNTLHRDCQIRVHSEYRWGRSPRSHPFFAGKQSIHLHPCPYHSRPVIWKWMQSLCIFSGLACVNHCIGCSVLMFDMLSWLNLSILWNKNWLIFQYQEVR